MIICALKWPSMTSAYASFMFSGKKYLFFFLLIKFLFYCAQPAYVLLYFVQVFNFLIECNILISSVQHSDLIFYTLQNDHHSGKTELVIYRMLTNN